VKLFKLRALLLLKYIAQGKTLYWFTGTGMPIRYDHWTVDTICRWNGSV